MSDHITVTGLVATTPRHLVTSEGLAITSFRLASNQRRFDRGKEAWVDGETNWYTVTGFRRLALNAAASLAKGDRVVVSGRLRVRDWSQGERAGTTVEIEADAFGHDLAWGQSRFTRSAPLEPVETNGEPGPDPAAESAAAEIWPGVAELDAEHAEEQVDHEAESEEAAPVGAPLAATA